MFDHQSKVFAGHISLTLMGASRIVLKATFPRGRDILGERAVCCRVDPLRGDPDVQGDEGGRDPGHPGQEGSQEERQPRLLTLLL